MDLVVNETLSLQKLGSLDKLKAYWCASILSARSIKCNTHVFTRSYSFRLFSLIVSSLLTIDSILDDWPGFGTAVPAAAVGLLAEDTVVLADLVGPAAVARAGTDWEGTGQVCPVVDLAASEAVLVLGAPGHVPIDFALAPIVETVNLYADREVNSQV